MIVSQNQTTLIPATPTVEDMLGAHIEFVFARPHMRADIIETGIVKQIKFHRNLLYMLMTPDSGRHERWISEEDFISYARTQPAAPVSVAALAAAVSIVAVEEQEECEADCNCPDCQLARREADTCPSCGGALSTGRHQIRRAADDFYCEPEETDNLAAVFNLCVQAGRRS